MTEYFLIITTTGTKALAKKIANKLVELDLAKCTQISSIDSIYKWENKIIAEPEFRLVIKAPKSNEEAIFAKIKEMHTYDLPQIISLNIDSGDKGYLKWLKV